MIRYGVNPIGWSNDDDPSLGGHIALEQCLREASEIGFAGIEKGHKMPSDARALRAALAPWGLDFVSGWYSLGLVGRSVEAEKAAMEPHLRLLRAMGCEVCILSEAVNTIHGDPAAPLSARPVLSHEQWPGFTAALTEIARHVAAAGLTPVYHHHMGTVVQSGEDLKRLLSGTGEELKLLLDTGHALMAGMDPGAVAETYAARIGHLHLKNVRAPVARETFARGWSFLDAVRAGVFTVPGDKEGAVDFMPVLEAAAGAGYDGWLVIEAEQDPIVRKPFEYKSMGLAALREMARDAGLDRTAHAPARLAPRAG